MTDRENKALYIAEECRKAGMSLAGAAGVLANIEAESAFKSTNLQDCFNSSFGVSDDTYTAQVDAGTRNFIDGAGYGLAQWTSGDRKQGMLRFHKARGKSIGDFKTQVDWLIEEMQGYSTAWNTCTTSNNAYECGYAICRYYEIPADTINQAKYRGGRAENWYVWLQRAGDTQSEIPSDPTPPSAEKPKAEAWPPRTIDARCGGWPEVKLLQSILQCRGYTVVVNGLWSAELTNKVIAFQKNSGLVADGIVGDKTWGKLLAR